VLVNGQTKRVKITKFVYLDIVLIDVQSYEIKHLLKTLTIFLNWSSL